jgi:uncharacterized Zn finger protein
MTETVTFEANKPKRLPKKAAAKANGASQAMRKGEQQARVIPARPGGNPDSDMLQQIGGLLRGDERGEEGEGDSVPDAGVDDSDRDDTPEQDEKQGDGEDGAAQSEADESDQRELELGEIKSFKDLAKAAGIELEELYGLIADLEVGFGDRVERPTFGQLKDLWRDQAKERFKIAEERQRVENETIQARGELNEVFQMIQIPEAVAKKAQAKYRETMGREQAALFAAVPRMAKDAGYRKQVRDAVVELGKAYGIRESEIDGLGDHRVYKLAMDFAELRGKFAEADAGAKRVQKVDKVGGSKRIPLKASAKKQSELSARAMKTGLQEHSVSAISNLLGSLKR